MATYRSEEVTLGAPASAVFDKLNNLEGLGDLLKNAPVDQIPEEQREKLNQIQVTSDSISFPGGPMGAIMLKKTKSISPELIELQGEGTPVPMGLVLKIIPLDVNTCTTIVEINIDIPMMLKPMVNGPLNKMTTEFANMLRRLPF